MAFPKVSVICSSYNSSEYLEGYCHSLNGQLLPEFEIIFVDAASTDDSLARFREFEFRDGIQVRVIECRERVPVYQAWNLAIEASDSDYCMNFNTDDRLYPAALLTMAAYAGANPEIDVFYPACFVVTDSEHRARGSIYDWPGFSHEELLKYCICGPFPLLKREAIVSAGMFDPEYYIVGDYEMWLRMSRAGYRFQKVPEVTGSYYRNPRGLSTDASLDEERVRQVREIQKKYR